MSDVLMTAQGIWLRNARHLAICHVPLAFWEICKRNVSFSIVDIIYRLGQ
jgi:hypothetical protein